MRAYSLIAPAKINLYLEIVGDRPDGYHELITIFQSISLADRLYLRPLSVDKIWLHCDHPEVPDDQTNLAYRAAELMFQKFSGPTGVEIIIDKQIPVGAGLAGGSADAAAVLAGIDLMWDLGLTQGELQELGVQLGADVPFCLQGGTALALGRGEVLSPLPDVDRLFVVLGKYRSLSVSTPWAYNQYRTQFGHTYRQDQAAREMRHQQFSSGAILKALTQLAKGIDQGEGKVGQCLHNDLEQVVLPAYPQVSQLREQFQRLNSSGTLMSGSGPTVFALAESQLAAEQLREAVQAEIPDPDLDLWIARCCRNGVQIV